MSATDGSELSEEYKKAAAEAWGDIQGRLWMALTEAERKAWRASGEPFLETIVLAGHHLLNIPHHEIQKHHIVKQAAAQC